MAQERVQAGLSTFGASLRSVGVPGERKVSVWYLRREESPGSKRDRYP